MKSVVMHSALRISKSLCSALPCILSLFALANAPAAISAEKELEIRRKVERRQANNTRRIISISGSIMGG